MRKIITDEEGYLKLPEGIREKYGKEFRIAERENVIDLKPVETEDRADN